jgi:GNAT superfamily N-acetyltransferase
MSQRLAHDAEASMSWAALPAPDVAVARPEQGRGHASALLAYFDEAQAEQALWQEFRDHNASINNALTEALRVHEGPSWRIF